MTAVATRDETTVRDSKLEVATVAPPAPAREATRREQLTTVAVHEDNQDAQLSPATVADTILDLGEVGAPNACAEASLAGQTSTGMRALIGRFLDEEITVHNGSEIGATVLFNTFYDWAQQKVVKNVASQTAFGRELNRRGIRKANRHNRIVYVGLAPAQKLPGSKAV